MELKETIMLKSFELFKRYGIRSVTMDEIAVQCGMSKKTVYQVFEDKDSLVEAIMDNHIKFAEHSCLESEQESENAIHEIFLSLDWVHIMYDGVNPALLFDLRKYHSSVYQKIENHKRGFLYEIFRKNIERGKAEGLYRPELKTDLMVPLRIHTMTLVFDTDLFPTNKYTLYEIDKEITLHGLYGLSTPRGVELIEKYINERTK